MHSCMLRKTILSSSSALLSGLDHFYNGIEVSLHSLGKLQRFPRENYEGLCLLKVDILGVAQAISTLHRKASAFLIVHGLQKI